MLRVSSAGLFHSWLSAVCAQNPSRHTLIFYPAMLDAVSQRRLSDADYRFRQRSWIIDPDLCARQKWRVTVRRAGRKYAASGGVNPRHDCGGDRRAGAAEEGGRGRVGENIRKDVGIPTRRERPLELGVDREQHPGGPKAQVRTQTSVWRDTRKRSQAATTLPTRCFRF